MIHPPSSILIVGSGVFGLTTALALTTRPSFSQCRITVLDRSPFPSPDGSSIDTSRIIRADYSDPAYASLAALAQSTWRSPSSPLSAAYTESGLLLVANKGQQGEAYVQKSYENIYAMAKESDDEGAVDKLGDIEAIKKRAGTGGGSGDWGYINNRSGWADAELGMRILRTQVEATGRVTFIHGEATSLLTTPSSAILGVLLKTGEKLTADLTILACGAWTASLIDLSGRAQSTGQVLCYLPITDSEQERLKDMPVLLNMSTGMFIIPPLKNILKVARHAYGYTNPVTIPRPLLPNPGEEIMFPCLDPAAEFNLEYLQLRHERAVEQLRRVMVQQQQEVAGFKRLSQGQQDEYLRVRDQVVARREQGKEGGEATISLPHTTWDNPGLAVPLEGRQACRQALQEMIPSLSSPSRPFTHSKICWYTDTPAGDFIITHHPNHAGLFLATGGSGHGYKFLPVIGEKIVDCIEGNTPVEFKDKWCWAPQTVENVATEDGSRGGRPGTVLIVEMAKG